MRRFIVVPLAALLVLAVAAPASAGPNTSNTSGSGKVISGELSVDGSYGYFTVAQEGDEPGFGDLYLESGGWVECDLSGDPGQMIEAKAITTDDTGPGEGPYGFVGTRTYGWAFDVEVSLSRRLETGSATGMVELYTETVDECAGIYGEPTFEIVPLLVSATGTGDLISFRGMGSSQVPSEFNGHYNYRGKERQATGHLEAGSISADFGWGYMSQLTWTEHVNS